MSPVLIVTLMLVGYLLTGLLFARLTSVRHREYLQKEAERTRGWISWNDQKVKREMVWHVAMCAVFWPVVFFHSVYAAVWAGMKWVALGPVQRRQQKLDEAEVEVRRWSAIVNDEEDPILKVAFQETLEQCRARVEELKW